MNTILKGLIFGHLADVAVPGQVVEICALVGIRTPNLLIRSEMLYPIELQVHFPYRVLYIETDIIPFFNGLQK